MTSLPESCCRTVFGIVLLAILLTGCATPAVKSQVRPVDEATARRLDGSWVAVIGEDRAFQFIGEYRDSSTNNGYQMFYPAPNFAGFLVGVATHAALQSAQNDAVAEEQRKVSDEVLGPYQQVLGEILVRSTFERALQMSESSTKIVLSDAARGKVEPEVDLAAQAIMAQSSRALMVDLIANVKNTSAPDGTDEYVHKVRVISDPIEANDAKINDYWLADDGDQLKQTVSHLLARAIDLFVADATQHLQPLQDKQITARYQFGNERRTERAVVLEQSCTRETLRTLRGWVLSVPVLDSLRHQRGCTDAEVTLHGESPPA